MPKKKVQEPVEENNESLSEFALPKEGGQEALVMGSVADLVGEEPGDDKVEGTPKPMPHDAEWQDYLLDMLFVEEKVVNEKGQVKPRTAGLQRIFEVVMGPITRAKAKVIESSPERAVVEYTIRFKRHLEGRGDDEVCVYTDVYECNKENTDKKFIAYAVPSCSTVAEGRTLKKALKLRVHTAEEIEPTPNPPENQKADNGVLATINLMMGRCKIDRVKYLNKLKGYYKQNWKDYEDMSQAVANEVLKNFNAYIQGTKQVPEDVLQTAV